MLGEIIYDLVTHVLVVTIQKKYEESYIFIGMCGIEPKTGLKPFLKTVLNFFVCIELIFFSRIIFIYLI